MLTKESFDKQARLCRALANPLRLWIIEELGADERSAGELREALDLSRVLLSQHMAILQQQRMVLVRKEGQRTFYRLSEPIIAEACAVVREVVEKLDAVQNLDEAQPR